MNRKPRAIMMLVPAGARVVSVIKDLSPHLQRGDGQGNGARVGESRGGSRGSVPRLWLPEIGIPTTKHVLPFLVEYGSAPSRLPTAIGLDSCIIVTPTLRTAGVAATQRELVKIQERTPSNCPYGVACAPSSHCI